MRSGEHERGAGDGATHPERLADGARERRLARAELPIERQQVAGLEPRVDAGAENGYRVGIGHGERGHRTYSRCTRAPMRVTIS